MEWGFEKQLRNANLVLFLFMTEFFQGNYGCCKKMWEVSMGRKVRDFHGICSARKSSIFNILALRRVLYCRCHNESVQESEGKDENV
jgi:hypothetical protein